MTNNQLVIALKFAALKHAGQIRKGTDLPYLVHPVEVAMTLQKMGFKDEVVIAGLLHDTIEDTDTTYEEIKDIFGIKVANTVLELTEVSKKRAYIKAQTYSIDAVLVKSADLIANVGNIYDDYQKIGDAVFDRFAHGKATLDHYRKMIVLMIRKLAFYSLPMGRNLALTLTKLESMV